MQELLPQLDQKKQQLDGHRPLSPDLLANLEEWFRVELTYTSNAIEGNTLTRSETALVVEKGITVKGKTLKEHLEAINHAEAIDYVKDLVHTKRSDLKRADILGIHALILTRIDDENAGRYRTDDVRIAGTHVVLPGWQKVGELMEDFLQWLTAPSQDHPVQVAADAHLKLVSIHPFIDGNGRTARLLMNLLLMQQGFPPALIRKEDRADYIQSIETAQTESNFDAYYKVIAQAVNRSLDVYLDAADPAKQDKFKLPENIRLLRIGEIASLTGETAVTIRHWTDEGLLETAHISESGYRYYHPSAVTTSKKIRQLQEKEGLSLEQIKAKLKN